LVAAMRSLTGILCAFGLLASWPLGAAATEERTAEAALAERTYHALERCLSASPEDPLDCRDSLGCISSRSACLAAETSAWEAVGAAAAADLDQALGSPADTAFVDDAEAALRARQRESCARGDVADLTSAKEAEASCLRDKSASRAASLWRVVKSLAVARP
ncbi:MAG: hypothetical protein AAF909_11975, partial [Pseudomonadota bacterium]